MKYVVVFVALFFYFLGFFAKYSVCWTQVMCLTIVNNRETELLGLNQAIEIYKKKLNFSKKKFKNKYVGSSF